MTRTRAQMLEHAAVQFTAHRPKLYAIARRTLGSTWDADDAVQEAWLRLQRAELTGIDNLEAWLTTVISRVCIDMIRRQSSRREDEFDEYRGAVAGPESTDPADALMRDEDLAIALHVMLDTLGPLERLALVLHDVFGLSYDDIAPIVERTAVASRQLASRARARLRDVDVRAAREQREAVTRAFLDAARNGRFADLLQLLDPEIELRSDATALELTAAGAEAGAPLLAGEVHGADAVARVFAGRAELARLVTVDGVAAAAYVTDGTVRAVYLLTMESGRISRVEAIADPVRLSTLDTVL